MPSSAGPNTAGESNLVFAYDTGDTINSYKGEPTVNYVVDPTHIGYSGYEFMQYTDLAPIFNTYGSSSLYSLSLDLKSANTANQNQILVYMQNGSTTKYQFVYQSVTATTEYQRFKIEGLSPTISNPADTVAMLAFYGIYGTGNYPYVKNVQVEIKPHCTPFVSGSRSVTQGLIPLVGTNTVNLTYASFNSNAQITFDGTNNYIPVTNTAAIVPTSNTSWEFILKPTSTSGYRAIFQKSNYGNSTGFIALFMNPSSLAFRLNASDVAESTRSIDHNFTGNITLNAYTHIVLTYNGTIFTLYINGVPTNTGAWAYGLGTNQGDMYIGNFWAGYWPGEIPIAKQYNTTLSTTQVVQNYQAYKTRFNLA